MSARESSSVRRLFLSTKCLTRAGVAVALLLGVGAVPAHADGVCVYGCDDAGSSGESGRAPKETQIDPTELTKPSVGPFAVKPVAGIDDETWLAVRDDPSIQELLEQRRALRDRHAAESYRAQQRVQDAIQQALRDLQASRDASEESLTVRAQNDPRVQEAANDLSAIWGAQDEVMRRFDERLLEAVRTVQQQKDTRTETSRQEAR